MVAGYFREASKVFEIDYWKRLVNIPILPFQEECPNTNSKTSQAKYALSRLTIED